MANTRIVSMRSNKAHNMRILSITSGIDSDNSHDSAGENGDDISKAELEEHSHDDLPYDIWGFMPDN